MIDLSGKIFGRFTILHEDRKKGYHRYWSCLCSCGVTKVVSQSNLISGKSTSCGCYAKELAGQTYKAKFQTHGDHNTRLYRIHKGMMNRCYKSWDNNYLRYGAIGIRVCQEWHEYPTFKSWAMAHGYTEELTLDREEGSKDYFPGNCRWATYTTQTRNRRKQSRPASSQYIGVSKEKRSKRWLASVCIDGITNKIGFFGTELEAAKARDQFIVDQKLQHFKMNF